MIRISAVAIYCTGIAMLASDSAHAELPNVAVIDVAKVFEQYEMTRELELMFDEKRRAIGDQAESRKATIDQMRRALTAFDPASQDFVQREQELMKAEVEFQVWFGYEQQQLKNEHKRWLLLIYRNTQKTVANIATAKEIDLVLTYDRLTEDAPDSVVLRQQILLQKVIYHSEQTDLTDEVLTKLNESFRAQGGIRGIGTPPSVLPSAASDSSSSPQ